jgi:hypothetical protein
MRRVDQGVVKDEKGQEQPTDKQRLQAVNRTDPKRSVSREATRDPKLSDGSETPEQGEHFSLSWGMQCAAAFPTAGNCQISRRGTAYPWLCPSAYQRPAHSPDVRPTLRKACKC